MWLRTRSNGDHGAGSMVGLDDHRGLFQPISKDYCKDAVICISSWSFQKRIPIQMNRSHRPSVDDPSFRELIHPKNRLLITLNAQTQIPAVGSSTPLCLAKKTKTNWWVSKKQQFGQHRLIQELGGVAESRDSNTHSRPSLNGFYISLNVGVSTKFSCFLLRQNSVLVKLWTWCVILYLFKKKKKEKCI